MLIAMCTSATGLLQYLLQQRFYVCVLQVVHLKDNFTARTFTIFARTLSPASPFLPLGPNLPLLPYGVGKTQYKCLAF